MPCQTWCQKPLELKREDVTSAILAQSTPGEGLITSIMMSTPPTKTTDALPFILHIPPSSELLNETLVSPFSSSLAPFFSLSTPLCSAFTVSLHLSAPGSMCHLGCFMQHQRCCLKRVNRHEGIKPTAPWQRRGGGGRDHQQCIEKTTLTKGIRQQMDLAIECVESFKS